MSKLGSKEEILSAIQSHFENIQSGNLTADEMESLVELTRELHERALILRYKSYEEKIFGIVSTSSGVDEKTEAKETEVVAEEAEITHIEPEEIAEEQHSLGFEEVETEILAAEAIIPEEAPVFDFDMFEKAESASVEEELNSNQPIELEEQSSDLKIETPTENQSNEVNDFSADQNPHFIQEEESHQMKEPMAVEHIEIPEIEAIQIANEVEEAPVTISQETPIEAYKPVENPKAEEFEAEIPLPEELALMNEPVIVPEKAPEVQQAPENDMFRRFSNNNSDDSLSSRLTATKLHTLNGAFGLNEKLQCIRELFKGSSEAFNQAIETLDQQENFSAAKRVLAQYAQQNSWNLESNLTAEFIQKIERRFL